MKMKISYNIRKKMKLVLEQLADILSLWCDDDADFHWDSRDNPQKKKTKRKKQAECGSSAERQIKHSKAASYWLKKTEKDSETQIVQMTVAAGQMDRCLSAASVNLYWGSVSWDSTHTSTHAHTLLLFWVLL